MGLAGVVMVSGGSCLLFLVCKCVYVCLYMGVLCYILGMGWASFGSFSFFLGCGLTMSGWFFGFRY